MNTLDLGEEVREDGRGVELKRKHASGKQKQRDEHGDKAPAHMPKLSHIFCIAARWGGITGGSIRYENSRRGTAVKVGLCATVIVS